MAICTRSARSSSVNSRATCAFAVASLMNGEAFTAALVAPDLLVEVDATAVLE